MLNEACAAKTDKTKVKPVASHDRVARFNMCLYPGLVTFPPLPYFSISTIFHRQRLRALAE